MAAVGAALLDLAAATNPITVLSSLTYRGWAITVVSAAILYLRQASTLARKASDSPCPQYGIIFRVLYGLFGTWVAEAVLGRFLHTPEGEPQAEQKGGTKQTTIGPPELRVKMVPILGEAFGGNYAFLVWDEEDTQRRAIVVDPADPLPVLQSAEADGLQIVAVLTTHWHFDHSSGNSTLARKLRELRVVASALEVGRTPSVTHRMKDLEELTIGRLVVRGHSVPGHTRGSMVYEIFNAEQKADAPSTLDGRGSGTSRTCDPAHVLPCCRSLGWEPPIDSCR